jgi:hypothetical protein
MKNKTKHINIKLLKIIFKRIFVFYSFLPLSLILYPLSLHAGGPGTTSVQVLKMDISPRALGMGGNFVAIADDIYSMNYNPAGFGQIYVPEVSAMHLSGFEDSKVQFLGFGMPLPVLGLASLEKPGFGVSALFSGSGKLTYRKINDDGTISTKSLDAESNTVLTFSYGEKVYSVETNFDKYPAKLESYFGASIKYISSELVEDYSASAIAFDAGYLLMEPNLGLCFGLSLANFGTKVKYIEEKNSLPSILRAGISYQKPTVMDQSVLASIEYDSYVNEKTDSLRVGVEYLFMKIFSFRFGYKMLKENNGLAVGFGLNYENFILDFGTTFSNQVFNATQIGLSYKFTGVKIKTYKKAKKYLAPGEEKEKIKKQPKPEKKPKKKTKEPDFLWIH